jgi:hypothetical protein
LYCVASNDDFCGDGSSVTWFAEANTTYKILIHGNNSESGTFGLNVSSPMDLPVMLPATNASSPCVNVTFSLTLQPFSTETYVAMKDFLRDQVYWDDQIFERPKFFDPVLPLVYNLVECVNPVTCYRFEINHPYGNSIPEPEPGEFALTYDSEIVNSGEIGATGSVRIFYFGGLCYMVP